MNVPPRPSPRAFFFALAAAWLALAPSSFRLAAQTVYTWNSGDILTATGTTTFNTNETLNIVTNADHDIATRAVVTNGTVNWIAGAIRGGGSLTNNGQWFDSASAQINAAYGAYSFVNSSGATYTKTAGTTAFNVGFNNNGTISVTGGTLTLNAGGTFASGASIGSSGSGVVELGGGTLTVNGSITVTNFVLNGGTLAGPATLTGTMSWLAGNMNAAGVTTFNPGSTLTISGTGNRDFSGRTIANHGTIDWLGGQLRSGGGGSISNYGVWNDSASGFALNNDYGGAGGTTFVNQTTGIYNKLAGTSTLNAPLVNYGTVVASGGTLNLNAGGTFHDGSSIGSTGSGVVQLTGGTLTAGGSAGFTASNFKLTGGSAAGNMTFLGTSEWIGTDFNTSGTATVGAGATFVIANAGNHDFQGHAIVNQGTVNWSDGHLRSGSGGTITNQGVWNDSAVNSSVNNAYGGAGATTFINAVGGSYYKTAGITTMSVPFVNRGTVAVSGGTLNLGDGGVFHDGSVIGSTGSGVVQLTGGTLTASGSAGFTAGNFKLTNGRVSGNMTLLGVTEWTGADFNAPGTATIGAGATLNITGSANHDFMGHAFDNQGTVNWQGGNLRSGSSGTITNHAQWNDTANGFNVNNDYGGAGGTTFVNAAGGVYTKTAGSSSISSATFVNHGVVSVTGGQLSLSNATFQPGSTIGSTGSGVVQHVGGTLTAAGTVNVQNFLLNGGTLAGTQTFAGTLSWLTGTLNSSGTTTIGAGATFTIGGTANHDFTQRAIVNQGTVQWTGGNLRGGSGATLTNQGIFNDSGSGYAINNDYGGGGGTTFVNAATGVYNKLGGNTTISAGLANLGLIDVAAGSLTVTGSFNNTGSIALGSGATLAVPLAATFQSGSALRGSGSVSSAALSFAGDVSPGTASTTGTLTLNGAVSFLPGATITFDVAGTTPGQQFDRIAVNGIVTLGGDLGVRFAGGFQTSVTGAMTFDLMSTTALLGSFSNVANGGRLSTLDGLGSFQVNYGLGSPYGLNQVVLSDFVAVPEPSTWVLLTLGLGVAGYRGWRQLRRRE